MDYITAKEFFKLSGKEKEKYIFFSKEYEYGLDIKHYKGGKWACEDCGKDFKEVWGTSDPHEPKFCLKCFKKQFVYVTEPKFIKASDYTKDLEHKNI